jgi:membrane fusion protein (multidrug efflux system)
MKTIRFKNQTGAIRRDNRTRPGVRAKTLMTLFCGLSLTACHRPPPPQSPPPPEVATITVAIQPLVLTMELPGRTAPYRIAEIRPQINGLIQKRLFTEGSDVQAGQDLYQLDPAPFQAVLDNAKAALGRSEANLPALQSRVARLREAVADKAVSQQDYDDTVAALNQAGADVQYWKATVSSAQINLAYSRIVSPISGRIGKSTVTDGAIVSAYQPLALATVQQLDPIYVDVPQSTAELLRLQRRFENGQLTRDGVTANKVQLVLDDGIRYPLDGELQFRDVSVDPSTASVILRMVFPNPTGVLLPGMFVRAMVQEGVNGQAILIPQQAVSRDPKGNPMTLIVNDAGTIEQRALRLDRAIGSQWLVSSGLAVGDRVVVEGMQKVRPGSPVKAVGVESDTHPAVNPEKTAPAAAASK